MGLHIRQKKNSSGTVSLQIINRENRKYKVIDYNTLLPFFSIMYFGVIYNYIPKALIKD